MPVYDLSKTAPVIAVDKSRRDFWEWDFSRWADAGDTVESLVITAPTGITLISQAPVKAGMAVQAWFSFEGATEGQEYKVEAHVVMTPSGRENDFPINFYVFER